MRVKQECTGEIGSCTDVSGQSSFIDIFDMYRDNSPAAQRRWWAPSVQRGSAAAVPTLGAIRGKIVLAVINGPQGGRTEQYGLAQFSGWNDGDSDFVQDNYNVPNTGAIATKRDQVHRVPLSRTLGSVSYYITRRSAASSTSPTPPTRARSTSTSAPARAYSRSPTRSQVGRWALRCVERFLSAFRLVSFYLPPFSSFHPAFSPFL
jgi:1-phosphatidylinositol phosphodiesterase